ncbi:YhcN/YlaJ family sporulation lipoprotein [Priestia megaterium]|jgi:hypothetical protein|uniref:Sporulation protein n=2 Tax=Priestia TaxID=2800373 RepID=A0AA86LY03_PRIMG|nr:MULTISPECIES: YhcN/YlaJ family sporulation lipoprotein [Priestia]AXI31827.1 sporulation protein [Priestia megaterium]MBY0025695.1 YhcN/YlaJ family sporulation lipoprotein [Priestia aryabhattai]MCR8926313.1 YhcN/YlaJ family sporulation lipoprotein [Priestia megaterium]WEA44180.1 YhcN/YlaJ family sporulation lipoprotein [Priestia aryabhattai]
MVKKSILGIALITSMLTIGCQNKNTAENENLSPNNPDAINVNEPNHYYNPNNNSGTNYGYVRYTKNTNEQNSNMNQVGTFNREEAADNISKLSTAIPNIKQAATLVTDKDVLVAYKTDAKNRNNAADQVKRTAMSVVPRYYHVYVSDNPKHMDQIENISEMNTQTNDARKRIDAVIQQMLKSPQGRKMNGGEDANGREKNELNEPMTDKDMVE